MSQTEKTRKNGYPFLPEIIDKVLMIFLSSFICSSKVLHPDRRWKRVSLGLWRLYPSGGFRVILINVTDNWHILVDFDGTITKVDADVFVASRLLDAPRYKQALALFNAYENTEIGLLEYFYGYLSIVDINHPRFLECLNKVPIRRDLIRLIAPLIQHGVVTIVSEGLDIYIRPILQQLGLGNAPTVFNRVVDSKGTKRIIPDPMADSCDRCLSCKGSFIRKKRANHPSIKIAVIGNGASDLCAAKASDTVFARDTLALRCNDNEIDYIFWHNAADIEKTSIWTDITSIY